MKRLLIKIGTGALGGLLLVGVFTAGAVASDSPILVANNPSCTGLGYDFGWKPQPEPPPSGTYTFPDGIHTATITSNGTYFDWTSTLGVDAVIVKGGPNANVYVYDPPAESFGDTALRSPTNPSNGMPYAISHIEFCYDYEVDVTKTAQTAYTRTFNWTIDKSVTPATWNLFSGDTGTSKYTVAVTKTGYTDSDWAVSGTITIANDTPFDAAIAGVSDVVSPGIGAAVECGVGFPYTLVAGGTLECSYSTPLPDGANRTNTATVTTTGTVGGNTGTAAVTFGDPTTKVNEAINVDDTNGSSWSFGDSGSVTYERTFACNDDEGTHDNTATIRETGQADGASVTVNCYDLAVEKNAKVSDFSQEYFWKVDKRDDATYDLFTGDSQVHPYAITVTRLGVAAESAVVSGDIWVGNPAPIDAQLTGVGDVISGSGLADVAATVSCPSLVVPSGGSLHCTYTANVTSSGYDLNTATATLQNYGYASDGTKTAAGTTDYAGTARNFFSGVSAEPVPVSLVDDNGTPDLLSDDKDLGEFPNSGAVGYLRTFECNADEGTLVNTAKLVDGDGNLVDSDSASVTVNCYALTVEKGADESLTRTWTWKIDKSADQTDLLLSAGQLFTVNYSVDVTATSIDSAWAVTGEIVISNPHPTRAAVLTNVADLVSPDIAATVNCPASMVPAGGQLTCTYSTDLPDGTTRTNTATATLQNLAFGVDGSATPNGTTDFDGSATVDFAGATVTEIDECVDVTDTNLGTLGIACASTSPTTFFYQLTFGQHPDADVYLECGDNTHRNVASFVSNDTGATGEDAWTVSANVACDLGCTLTPGYWKTHSSYGPAPYDDTWAMLANGADTAFFLSGQSYYQVLWTAPQGNAYYILAHAYIASQLNSLNGASAPQSVQDAFDQATTLLTTYTPAQVAALKGKAGNELRAQFISLAGILDGYNNGLTGPGHCSE